MVDQRITIGDEARGLQIVIHRRSHPGCEDYWDGNWLSTTIFLALGGFQGKVACDLRAEDFAKFRHGLEQMLKQLPKSNEARFTTMEEQLELKLSISERGAVQCTGILTDYEFWRNKLSFEFDFDQSYLPNILSQIAEIEASYPVIGQK